MSSVAVVADSMRHKPSLVPLVEGFLGQLMPFLLQLQLQPVSTEHEQTNSSMPHKVVGLLPRPHKLVAHSTVVAAVAVAHLAYNFDSKRCCSICMRSMSQYY
jgi:hypothetical protein